MKVLESDDIIFYKGRKKTIFEHDIMYYEGVYYLYIYANREGEFTVNIDNVLYKDTSILESVDIIKPFNITNNFEIDEETNETLSKVLGIRPGFVYAPTSPIIKLYNKGTLNLSLRYGKEKITLEPMTMKEIKLDVTENFSYFDISGYKDFSVPVIHPTLEDKFTSPLAKSELEANPKTFSSEVLESEKKIEFIEITNPDDVNISDFQITSDIEFLEFEKLEDMTGKGVQNLSIEFKIDEIKHFAGTIEVTYFYGEEEGLLRIPVSIYVLEEGTNETEFEVLGDSCNNLNGTVCSVNFECEEGADQPYTSDHKLCCLGECIPIEKAEKKEDKNKYGLIIALVILAGIVAYGFYMYKKQKNFTPKKPGEKLKESTEKFEKRMAVKPRPSLRVKGTLQKS